MQIISRSGRYVKAAPVRDGEHGYDVAIDATLRAAILRQAQTGQKPLDSFSVMLSDLRKKVFKRPRKTLIIVVVDASDSMGQGTYARMKAAKGAVLALLAKARQKRDRLGLIAFRDESAEVVLRPTSSLTMAQEYLKSLPTGGATPFAGGLMKAWQLIKTERLKDPEIKPLLVVISDGEANVPFDSNRSLLEVMDELLVIAGRISKDTIRSIAIDTKPRFEKSNDMLLIAKALGADYHHINYLRAGKVVEVIQSIENK